MPKPPAQRLTCSACGEAHARRAGRPPTARAWVCPRCTVRAEMGLDARLRVLVLLELGATVERRADVERPAIRRWVAAWKVGDLEGMAVARREAQRALIAMVRADDRATGALQHARDRHRRAALRAAVSGTLARWEELRRKVSAAFVPAREVPWLAKVMDA